MAIKTVIPTNKTIDSIGLTTKPFKAIFEYIWNGFDAGATRVDLIFDTTNSLEEKKIIIKDNGHGIDYESFDSKFRPLLDSEKGNYAIENGTTHGRKGKGRFSFEAFADSIERNTCYKSKDSLYQYTIKSIATQKEKYEVSDSLTSGLQEGTTVICSGLQNITITDLISNAFVLELKTEFGRFLELQKEKNCGIYINDVEIEYADIIKETKTDKFVYTSDDSFVISFDMIFILRNQKIGEDSQNYYLNNRNISVRCEDNQTNNKGDGFYNSLYVTSTFFDSFQIVEKKSQTDGLFQQTTKYDDAFKKLKKHIESFLLKQKQKFLRENASKIIEGLYERELMPTFGDSEFEEIKKENYDEVVKSIYIYDPQLFEGGGNVIQKKTILSLIKSLLEGKREDLLKIIDELLHLNDEQIKEFAGVLEHTKIEHITKLVNFLIGKKRVYLLLKNLVEDHKKRTTERDHIQKIIEANYRLFGEQYTLISADKNFDTLKSNYCAHLDKQLKETEKDPDLRRPDIFMVKSRPLTSHNPQNTIQEHVMIELKRPSQPIGKDQIRQIEDYMDKVIGDSKLHGAFDQRKFYVISNDLDVLVQSDRDDKINFDDPFLIKESKSKYRIYALTWHELFSRFENTYGYYLENLDIDDKKLLESLKLDTPDEITNHILQN